MTLGILLGVSFLITRAVAGRHLAAPVRFGDAPLAAQRAITSSAGRISRPATLPIRNGILAGAPDRG